MIKVAFNIPVVPFRAKNIDTFQPGNYAGDARQRARRMFVYVAAARGN